METQGEFLGLGKRPVHEVGMEFTSAVEENILLFLPGWCLPGRKERLLSCTYLGKRRRRSEGRNSREIKFISITARSQCGEQGLGAGQPEGRQSRSLHANPLGVTSRGLQCDSPTADPGWCSQCSYH